MSKFRQIVEAIEYGDCYEANGRLLLFDLAPKAEGELKGKKFRPGYEPEPPLLCHGYPIGTGKDNYKKRFGHCWVEWQDLVFDESNGKHMVLSKHQYYSVGRIREREVIKYTPDEVRKMILRYHHWGPWHKEKYRR